MTNYISPGTYVVEKDFSDYVAAIGSTSVGMVGTAKKGPLNIPTLITTTDQFISTFGEPSVNEYGPHGAINYLRKGKALYYLRVAKVYEEEVATMVTQPVASGANYNIVVSASHGITVGDYIRVREDGKRTSWALKVLAVAGETLTIDGDTYSRWIETYTTAAVVDKETADIPAGDASNQAEVFAFGRSDNTVSDLVKFTARNGGAWANFGSDSGIEIQILDGGGFSNIDPITGNAYENSDGTLAEGVMPGAPSVDTFEELIALTGTDVASRQTRGVNKDYFNTAIVDITTSSGSANFEVADASFFSSGQDVIVHGSYSGSSEWMDGDYIVANVNTTTDIIALAEATGIAYDITLASSAAGGTKITVTGATAAAIVTGCDFLDVNLTGHTELDVCFARSAIVSTSGQTITLPVAWDSDFSDVSSGTIIKANTLDYSSGTTEGYLINTEVSGPAGVYMCSTVLSGGAKWQKVGLLSKQVKVLYQGRVVEHFETLVGNDTSSDNYWDTVIGTVDSPVSEYVYCEYLGSNDQPINTYHKVKHPNNPKLTMGQNVIVKVVDTDGSSTVTKKNSRGVDGSNPDESAYIGTISDDGVYTGLQCFRQVERWDINLLCSPGQYAGAIVAEIVDICATRNDCLGIIDTPFGLKVQDAIDWHNGQGVYSGEHSAFASNRAAAYYPWVKQYDSYTRSDIWLPPSAVVPAIMAYSDRVGELWFAPAGITRGSVPNARDVETFVSQGDMDAMYGPGNGNALNAIVSFPKDGIVVYGNRTLQRTATALDRINVRRLLFYIEKTVAASSRRLVFEQNDSILWGQFKNLVVPFLDDLKGRRAIEWYQVVCDLSTNTAAMRNNNTMGARIYIIPVKSAEKIELQFTLLPSGADVEEFIAADLGN